MVQTLPAGATAYQIIKDHILENRSQYIGISVDWVNVGHKFIARRVNKATGEDVDEFDVVQTLRIMVLDGDMKSVGWYGHTETFSPTDKEN